MHDLTATEKTFILHWGEMGSTWGINRTVAQIYALLYLSPDPLTAEDISATLAIARSTVSTGLRELQGWEVVRVVHVLGDRRDHFEAMTDVWEMFRMILRERKHREVDPTLAVLRRCVSEVEESGAGDTHIQARLQEMLDFFETVTAVFEQVEQLPTQSLKRLAHLGDEFAKILGRFAQS